MTPFLIAAIACGLVVFVCGTILRPWLDKKRQASDSDREPTITTSTPLDQSKTQGNYRSATPILFLLTGICILFLVTILEYIYIEFVHHDLNRQYFFDGPYFRQIVFGCVFGAFLSFWLMRGMTAAETKKDEQSVLQIKDKEKNVAHEAGEGATHRAGNADSETFALYNELPTAIILLIIFLFGVFDEATIVRIAQFGGNVKLPGGVEFAFGRNESRSSETSVAQLVPPSNSQNSYAPPSVSQGLQSLAELGQTMRRDALIYALSKRLVIEADEAGKVAFSRSNEKSAKSERSTDVLTDLHTQIDLVDKTFVKVAGCFISENEQHLDYVTSGDKILPIAQKFNVSLREKRLNHEKEEMTGIFSACEAADKQKYIVNKQDIFKLLKTTDELTSPYTWIAVANIFEYNHRYVAAIALLENWLHNNKLKLSVKDRDVSDIFEIRVRSMVGGYVYEWMNYQPIAKTQAVIEYYRINLDRTIEALDRVLKNVFTTDKKYTMTANWDCESHFSNARWSPSLKIQGSHDLPPLRMKLALIYSLLSMKQSWINAVMDGADYKEHRNRANEYAQELRKANVNCMGFLVEDTKDESKGDDESRGEKELKAENYVSVLRATNYDAYARVMRANANLLEDPAERKSHLNAALSAAEEGFELVKEIAEHDRHLRRFPKGKYEVSFRTSGTPALEVAERLEEVIRRLNAELGRL